MINNGMVTVPDIDSGKEPVEPIFPTIQPPEDTTPPTQPEEETIPPDEDPSVTPEQTSEPAKSDAANEENEETGETETAETTETTEVPTSPDKFELDALHGTLMGVSVVLALAVAVLSVLLRRGKKRSVPTTAYPVTRVVEDTEPAAPSTIPQVGKLHQLGDRESQQDCFAVSAPERTGENGLLAVVADGMGGLADGDKVSQTAVGTMLGGFLSARGAPEELLLELTERANRQINQLLGPRGIGKSGSTLVAGLVKDGRFHYLSIGDSRICLYRDDQLIQLNREHIYRNDLSIQALNGIGSLYGAAAHPKAAGLTSYLGMGTLKYVDIPAAPIELRSGDKIILMSDGVYNALTEAEIREALHSSPERAADRLGEMIADKAYRHQDNYTAVILGF